MTHNERPNIVKIENTGLVDNQPVAEGEELSLSIKFMDSDGAEDFTTVVTWGDGTESVFNGTRVEGVGHLLANHVYADGGVYEVKVTVIDGEDEDVSSFRKQSLVVTGAGVQDGVLNIVGTRSDDWVDVSEQGAMTLVNASFLGQSKAYTDFDTIRVHLFDGNDFLTIDQNVIQPALVYGGDGNDNLTVGGGNDEVLGEEGDDVISGNRGHDLLVGGPGNDYLNGNAGNDILLDKDGERPSAGWRRE